MVCVFELSFPTYSLKLRFVIRSLINRTTCLFGISCIIISAILCRKRLIGRQIQLCISFGFQMLFRCILLVTTCSTVLLPGRNPACSRGSCAQAFLSSTISRTPGNLVAFTVYFPPGSWGSLSPRVSYHMTFFLMCFSIPSTRAD